VYRFPVVKYLSTVLCIDDDAEMLEAYRRILHKYVDRLLLVSDPREGHRVAASESVDIVILDLRMPEEDGLTTLGKIRSLENPPEVIMATGRGGVSDAVEAMKLGAADFIEKPFSPIQLRQRLAPFLKVHDLELENRTLRETGDPAIDAVPGILGFSAPMRELKTTIVQLARTDVTVTITGESGTGKELVARGLHRAGPRAAKPFVVVDCGALPATMIESELFGHVKGAFTGAHHDSPGLFRAAEGGTLMIDEVGELPLPLQTRLLRSIQEREVRPVGASVPVPVNVRIVAATNRNLREAVEAGTFREDLYYRLASVTVRVPALRDHRGDIPVIAHHFASTHTSADGGPMRLSDDAVAVLSAYDWPGNVRELEHVIAGAAALSVDSTITDDVLQRVLPALASAPTQPQDEGFGLRDAKDAAIDDALLQTDGNRRRAAQILGVAESTIYRNLKRRNLL